MATAFTQEHDQDNFILELNRVKEKVRTTFMDLRECLTERENKLMKDLNDILSRYLSYRTESKKMYEEKQDIENIRDAHLGVLPTSPAARTFHEKMLQELNDQLVNLQFPVKPKLVKFVCDKNQLFSEVNKLCKLIDSVNEIDYASKTHPMISVSDRGTDNEQLNMPLGVTVDDNTGNIYVADQLNNCVKVFDRNGKYLFKFGNREEGKMNRPVSIIICGKRVLISEFTGSILVYQLDGKFISRIGTHGTGVLEFNGPFGLTTDESNGDIYACDRSNNRIQILFRNFQYKSQFGKDILNQPRDVKLYKDNIFILDTSNPCLHIYNKDLVLHKSVISRGEGQQVVFPRFFFIDTFGNFLISDCSSNSILILTSEFDFLHKISVSSQPMGITLDREDRIIVLCQAVRNCLQIF